MFLPRFRCSIRTLKRGLLPAGIFCLFPPLIDCRHDPTGRTPRQPGALRVALLMPGPVDDHGWSQAGYEGLGRIERELGAEVAHSASVPPGEYAERLRGYAAGGCDFIIAQGGEFIPAAETVANEFPRTRFAVVAGYPGNNRNLGALSFRDGEIAFLAGVVGGLKTRSRKLGFVGGVPYAHVHEQAALFERGVHHASPGAAVTTTWLHSWTDTALAASTARGMIHDGVDVIVADADMAGEAVIAEARNAHVYAIGWSLDQYDLAPGTVLTSAIQHVPMLLLEGAILVQRGRWEGKQYKFGLRERVMELAPFRGLLDSEQERRVAAAREGILMGTIDVAP